MFLFEEKFTDKGYRKILLNFADEIPYKVYSNAVTNAKQFAAENLDVYIPDAGETIKST